MFTTFIFLPDPPILKTEGQPYFFHYICIVKYPRNILITKLETFYEYIEGKDLLVGRPFIAVNRP